MQQRMCRTAVPATQRFQPLAYRVDDAAAVIGVSDGKVWRLIREGRIPARKLDGSTVIRHDDLAAFIDGLPPVQPSAVPPRPSLPIPRLPAAAPVRSKAPPARPAAARPVQPADLVPTAKYRRGPLSPDKILRTPTPGLATVIGIGPLRRPEVMAKLWDYIRAHELQAEVDRRVILADPNLKAAFGLDRVSMHDLNRLVKARLTPGWEDHANLPVPPSVSAGLNEPLPIAAGRPKRRTSNEDTMMPKTAAQPATTARSGHWSSPRAAVGTPPIRASLHRGLRAARRGSHKNLKVEAVTEKACRVHGRD